MANVTYEVYTITCGVKSPPFITHKKAEAVECYSSLRYTGALPRISVNGRQLTIAEATKYDNPRLGAKARMKRNAVG